MIINIRGTSGSGKSTLVRRVMALYPTKARVKIEGRKRPIGYILSGRPGDKRPLAVIGHYETDCGGCDTITSQDDIYDRVRKAHAADMNVLYEGLLISADANRVIALHTDGLPLHVVALSTPLEVCLASVNARREGAFKERLERIEAENAVKAEAGRKLLPVPEPKGEVNPKNTASKFSGVKSSMKRLEAAGLSTHWLDRDQAFEFIVRQLDGNP